MEITGNTEDVGVIADISIKSDHLMDLTGKELTRFPVIGKRKFSLRKDVAVKLFSPHGGCIFVALSKALTSAGVLTIKINGAYKAPYYKKGVDTTTTWNA
jgi:hypothetical protein